MSLVVADSCLMPCCKTFPFEFQRMVVGCDGFEQVFMEHGD